MNLLQTLRILDENKQLSLTNAMMFVLIAKVALSPSLDWPTISALFLACSTYQTKKLFTDRTAKREEKALKLDEKMQHIEALTRSVASLEQESSLIKTAISAQANGKYSF